MKMRNGKKEEEGFSGCFLKVGNWILLGKRERERVGEERMFLTGIVG